MQSHHRNPYRIPKPKTGRLWTGTLRHVREDGRFKGFSTQRYDAILTSTHLWLSKELAIPLQSIIELGSIDQGQSLSLRYLHALSRDMQEIRFTMVNFWSGVDTQKLAQFTHAIQTAWQTVRPPSRDLQSLLDLLGTDACCETCGSAQASLLNSGYHLSIGIFPWAWMARWTPVRPYLCQRHAVNATCRNNLLTSALGSLGIPGVITAPFYAIKNTLRLKKTHAIAVPNLIFTALCGLIGPILIGLYIWSHLAQR